MSNISAEWKKTLTIIVEDLSSQQYEKLLEILVKIPQCQKEKSREKLPQIILEHYSLDGSVSAIADAMEEIPRRDPKIQSLLQPFVEKLKAKEEKNKSKRKTVDPQTEEETARAGAVSLRSQSTMADQPTTETPSSRKSIRDLIANNESVLTDTIGGRVMQKFTLRISSTKKAYFFVLLRDETASLKLMVYGKPHHLEIKEGKYYSFRKLLRDETGQVKVTSETVVSEIGTFTIPEEVEKEARQLCSKGPFYSIKDFKTLDSGTGSVKATITELNPSKSVAVKNQKKTEKMQSFCIEDDTDAIEVVFWGYKTQQCKNLSVGDVIVLNNVKINWYFNKVSLQSTFAANIEQVDKVGIRNVNIEIVGVIKAQKIQTHLEVKLDQKVQSLVVASKLLAEALHLTLGENFQSQLVSAIPVLAEAKIDGNKIKKITRIQK